MRDRGLFYQRGYFLGVVTGRESPTALGSKARSPPDLALEEARDLGLQQMGQLYPLVEQHLLMKHLHLAQSLLSTVAHLSQLG